MKLFCVNTSLLSVSLLLLPFATSQAAEIDDAIQAALNNPARLAESRIRDEARKPGEVIKFMGTAPGMTVLDLVGMGSGYYAEILAGIVGEGGRVISHGLPAQGMDPNNLFAAHIRNSPHLDNVVPIYANLRDLDLQENSVDQIFLILNFHDFYFEAWGIDPAVTLAMFRKILRPGGTLAVIDHAAPDNAPSSSGNTTHRISPVFTKSTLQTAGFILEGESNILRNDTDNLTQMVFAPEIRGKTSRFVLRYRNPE